MSESGGACSRRSRRRQSLAARTRERRLPRRPPLPRAAHGGRGEPAPLARGHPAAQRRARGPPRAARQVPQRAALALRAAARHRRHRLVLLQVWNLMRYVSLPGDRRDHIDSPPARSLEVCLSVCGCLFTCCCFVKLKLSNYAVEGHRSLISFCNIWALRVSGSRQVSCCKRCSSLSRYRRYQPGAPTWWRHAPRRSIVFTNYCFTALEHKSD